MFIRACVYVHVCEVRCEKACLEGMPGLSSKLFSTTPAGQRAERQRLGYTDTQEVDSDPLLRLKVPK